MYQTCLLGWDPLRFNHLIHRYDAVHSQESQNTMKFTHCEPMVEWKLTDILVMVNDGKSLEFFVFDLEEHFEISTSHSVNYRNRKQYQWMIYIYNIYKYMPSPITMLTQIIRSLFALIDAEWICTLTRKHIHPCEDTHTHGKIFLPGLS